MNIAYNVKMYDPALDFLFRKKQKSTTAKFSFPPNTRTEKLIVSRVRFFAGQMVVNGDQNQKLPRTTPRSILF